MAAAAKTFGWEYFARVAEQISREGVRAAPAQPRGTKRVGWWRLPGLVVSVSALLTLWGTAQPPAFRPGLYNIEVRLELPYVLDVSPPRRLTRCLTASAIKSGRAFFVLSENPISACPLSDYRATGTTARYRIRCPGPNAASAEGEFETTATGYRGTISMQMGAKNMTMSETQVAVRVGTCASDRR